MRQLEVTTMDMATSKLGTHDPQNYTDLYSHFYGPRHAMVDHLDRWTVELQKPSFACHVLIELAPEMNKHAALLSPNIPNTKWATHIVYIYNISL
jgi:hypothetical protein